MILLVAFSIATLQKSTPRLIRVTVLPLKREKISSVQLSPDGHLLLATDASKVSMYRLPSGAFLWSKKKGVADFTPDSQSLVLGQHSAIDLCRADSGKLIKEIENAKGPHDFLKVSLGGKSLLVKEDSISVSCWSLVTNRRLWTQRISTMGSAEGKFGDRLSFVPFDDGSGIVINSTGWRGEPMRGEWTMWSFDSHGRNVASSQSDAIAAQIDSPIEIPGSRIAFSNNEGDTWFTTVGVPGLKVVTMPGAPDANIWKMWRCGSKVLILHNGESLIDWPATGGPALTISLHRRTINDHEFGQRIPEWLDLYDVSADGRTVVLNEGAHLTLYRLLGG
jgi:hypothetical protein